MTILPVTPSDIDRFWAYVEKTDSCWNWTGYTHLGYGIFWAAPKLRRVHRLSYELAHGEIPDGMVIDHKCFNRGCVNPRHLRLATRKQNNEHLQGAYATSKSGVRGVSWMKKSSMWVGRVSHNGKLVYCGYFHDIKDAEAAVIAKRNEVYTHNDVDRRAI